MAAASARAEVRVNAAKDLWPRAAQPVRYGREQFRFQLDRSLRQLSTVDIDPWVETCTWQRAGGSRTGSLEFRRPLGSHPSSLVAYNDKIVCEFDQWGDGTQWRRLWTMKTTDPEHQVYEGMLNLTLSSELDVLTASRVAWKFRADKTHPSGWTARDMTLNAADRFNVTIGHLPDATYRIAQYCPKSASPEDIITWAWGQERRHTGRRFDIDSSTGVLNVTELVEPKYMLVFGAAMLDATLTEQMAGLASAVTAVATHKVKGHKKDTKLRARIVNADRLARYGYIVRPLHAPSNIQSNADLRDWATRRLATMFGQQKQLSFSHPGMPLVDRGTALRAYLPEADLDQVVFVTQIEHDLSAGTYEMQVTAGFDDPFAVDQRAARVLLAKEAAAVRRARAGEISNAALEDRAEAKNAKVRSNKK